MNALVPDGSLWLWAVMFALAALSFWVERIPLGRVLSGAMVALGGSLLLANVGVMPNSGATYDLVSSQFVAIAIPLLLFQADLRRIVRESGPTLYCSLIGSVTVVLGALIAFWATPLTHELAAKLAGVYAATYIGGTMNYVAVSEAVELGSAEFAAGLVADNIVTTLYLMALGALPAIALIRRLFVSGDSLQVPETRSAAAADQERASHAVDLDVLALALAMTLAFAIAAVGALAGQLTGVRYVPVLVATLITVTIATLYPRIGYLTRGSFHVGMLLMYVFFVTIGAGADIAALIERGLPILLFAATVVATHLILLLPAAVSLRLPLRETLIGSCATVSGPTVAAAMAASRGWHDLVVPGVLTGILGYIVANVIGIALTRGLS